MTTRPNKWTRENVRHLAAFFRQGRNPAARVYEVAYSGLRSQFDSRVRMVTKNLPGTLRQLDRRLLRRPLILLALFSHKLLRWATPLLLLAALILNIALAVQGRFIPLLIAQSVFYLAVIAGGLAIIPVLHVTPSIVPSDSSS